MLKWFISDIYLPTWGTCLFVCAVLVTDIIPSFYHFKNTANRKLFAYSIFFLPLFLPAYITNGACWRVLLLLLRGVSWRELDEVFPARACKETAAEHRTEQSARRRGQAIKNRQHTHRAARDCLRRLRGCLRRGATRPPFFLHHLCWLRPAESSV